MPENIDTIRSFLAAWSRMDAEELAGYFTEAGCYHNMPLDPVAGRENVRDFIAAFLDTWTATDWEIVNIVAAGSVVIAERVDRIRAGLVDQLRQLRGDGATIAAYGAAAKGSTLLNYMGIGTDLVDFVVDRNVHKQGRLMPGVHIPVRDTSALLEEQPDYVLMLAWNFKDEILSQQAEYRRRGGKFIVPIPNPEIL